MDAAYFKRCFPPKMFKRATSRIKGYRNLAIQTHLLFGDDLIAKRWAKLESLCPEVGANTSSLEQQELRSPTAAQRQLFISHGVLLPELISW